MKQFKDALIQNYSVHLPVIPIRIWDDGFEVHVNKFKQAGSTVQVTEATTSTGKTKYSYTHKPTLVPDYNRMKLFWATCLVHNLDSQILNKVALQHSNEWLLTIHDAILALPGSASRMRATYARLLKEVNKNRHTILSTYRQSIGATSVKADVAFYKLFKSVVQAEDIEFNASAMK